MFYSLLRLTRIYARIHAKRKRYVKDGLGADELFAITALVGICIPVERIPHEKKTIPQKFAYTR